MVKHKVLLVEAETVMQVMVEGLIRSICDLKIANTVAEANAKIQKNTFSLILVEVQSPDGDGCEFCEKLRKNNNTTPVLFFAKQADVPRIQSYNFNSADYIVKPFEPKEFAARVSARLRAREADLTIQKGSFNIHLAEQTVTLTTLDGTINSIDLTPIEFKLFSCLLKNESKVVLREDLLKSAWGDSVHVSHHTMDTHISSLRKKLKTYGYSLKSVFKKGYSFTCEITEMQGS
jgi:DNA-binding response OmpR family regulator